MKKTKIANELLKNTTNEYLKVFISNYISNMEFLEKGCDGDEKLCRFHNCITYIEQENFDITGWNLHEIPTFYAHCFRNKKKNQYFDLAVWDIGDVIPRYLDDDCCEKDAKSIQEAINNFSV